MRTLLERIDTLRSTRIYTVSCSKDGKTVLHNLPPVGCGGMYWLYTSYSFDEIKQSTKATNLRGAVDMSYLANIRADLSHTSRIKTDGFMLVYNGIGGVGPKGKGGLRERILQEFSGGHGTGSLAIRKSSLSDTKRWRYSYVTLKQGKHKADFEETYSQWAEVLEMSWRLEFGWPILCTK